VASFGFYSILSVYKNHWVTSSYKVTDTIDGKEVVARESFGVRIENNKIKEIIVAFRRVLSEEE
jgi:hypothetical protein